MEELLVRALREIADGALDDAILEVGIHAAEGELLSRVVAGLLEGIVVEAPVVAVVVEDLHTFLRTMLGGECLEGAFGSKSFRGCIVDLEVDKAQTAEVVNEDGGAPVAPVGEFAFHLCEESDFS